MCIKLVFKIEQDTLIKWKTLCNKSCRSCFIESRTVEFVFFWFVYDFISILQVYYLMRPGRQDLNVNFFLHLSHVANWMCDRHPFLKISLFGIYFWNFVFLDIKMKKAPAGAYMICVQTRKAMMLCPFDMFSFYFFYHETLVSY